MDKKKRIGTLHNGLTGESKDYFVDVPTPSHKTVEDLKLSDIERILLDYKYKGASKPKTLKSLYRLLEAEAIETVRLVPDDFIKSGRIFEAVPLSKIKELFGEEQ